MTEIVVEGPEMVLIEKIKRVRGKDKEVVKVVEKMKKAGVRVLRGDKCYKLKTLELVKRMDLVLG